MTNKNWTREETLAVFDAYCQIPFKDSSSTHPLVTHYAKLLGRTPAAVHLKIGNLGSFDPDLRKVGISGLQHTSKVDEQVWKEYIIAPDKIQLEARQIVMKLTHNLVGNNDTQLIAQETKKDVTEEKVYQDFFRNAVFASYGNRCCVTGIGNVGLLRACQINKGEKELVFKFNPSNGLCLNALLSAAYSRYLMAVTPDGEVVISDVMIDQTSDDMTQKHLSSLRGRKIAQPSHFFPSKEGLEANYAKYKLKNCL